MAVTAENIKALTGELETLQKSIKETLDAQNESLKKHGATTDDIATKMKEQAAQFDRVLEDMKSVQADVLKIKKGRARSGILTAGGDTLDVKSIGQALVGSDSYKSMVSAKQVSMASGVKLKGFSANIPGNTPAAMAARKFWHTKDEELTSNELGALIDHFRWDNLIQQPIRPTTVMDLMTVIPTNKPTINFPEETVTIALYTELAADSVSASPVVTVANAGGFRDGQTVYLAGASTVTRVIDTDGVDRDANTLTFTANVGEIIAAGGGVWSDDYVFTPEAKYKPSGRIEITNRNVNVKTLATWMPFAKQMLDDFTGLQALIDARMMQMMDRSMEQQLLYGDNGEDQIQGILTHASIQTYLWSAGKVGDTKLDALRRAITLVSLSHFVADTIVINDSDWEDIELAKGEDGHYLFFQIQTGPGITRVWRANVVTTSAIESGTALVANFSQGAAIWDRQDVEVSVSDQNRDWWERNLLGIRIEQRKAQSVFRPTAFVKVTFDVAPS